jgi:hypothetical protein
MNPESVTATTDAESDGYFYVEGIHGFTSHTGGNCGPYSWWKCQHDQRFYSWSVYAEGFHCEGGFAVVNDFGEVVAVPTH